MNLFPRMIGKAKAVVGALRPVLTIDVAGEAFSGLEYGASSPDTAGKLMLTIQVIKQGQLPSEGVRANAINLLPLTRYADFLGAAGQTGPDAVEAVKAAISDVANVTAAELLAIPTEHYSFLKIGTYRPGADEKVRITLEPAVDLAVDEWFQLALGDADADEPEAQYQFDRVDELSISGRQHEAVFIVRNRLVGAEVNDDMATHTKEDLFLTYQRGRDFQRSNFLREIAFRNQVQGWFEGGKLDNGALLLEMTRNPAEALDEVLFKRQGNLASKYHFLTMKRYAKDSARAIARRAEVAGEVRAKLEAERARDPEGYAVLRSSFGLPAPEEIETFK